MNSLPQGANRRGVKRPRRNYSGTSYGYGRAVGPARMSSLRPKRGEIKSLDTIGQVVGTPAAVGNWTAPIGGLVTQLNSIIIGPNSNNRIGRRVENQWIKVRGTFQRNPTFDPADFEHRTKAPSVRILLVWDATSNGTNPTVADILKDQYSSTTGAGVTDYMSSSNRDYQGRFTILMDFWKDLPAWNPIRTDYEDPGTQPSSLQTVATDIFTFDETRSLRGMATTYSTSTTIGANAVQSGGLYALLISNFAWTGIPADTPYNIDLRWRLYYKDQ